ncbi:MAG: F0F1 ATP synthase subunit beta [Candidatus Omnitrophota bacterium]|nr:MAG: F0F1 ATP synthase subunit beta [Candidatus Omnitrophota bacterium]
MAEVKGKISAVYGSVVDVQFQGAGLPVIYEIIEAATAYGNDIILEVVEHYEPNICRCIALTQTFGLKRNSTCRATGKTLSVPVGKELYGRILNVMGQPIDDKGPIKASEKVVVRRRIKEVKKIMIDESKKLKYEIMPTGIKVIDLLFPFVKGSKTGILGGAALGKTILILEIIHNVITKQRGSCIFSGVGERIREGNELYYEFEKTDLLKRSILVFGQMNESPGARFEAAQVGICLAEAFLNRGEDVLFFVDNVFRFAQAGAELSALLGRIPSETGYQPTLSSEISDFHERIRSTESASITCAEAVYVPADDLTDPAVVVIFSHLDSMLVLSRDYVQRGLYPAVDPLQSSSNFIDPAIVGRRHFDITQEVIRHFQRYQELQRIVSIIGKEELSQQERIIFDRARKIQNFLTQPFFTAELYTGVPGQYIPLEETIAGCEQIVSGKLDFVPEEKFYMVGNIEELIK